MVGSGGDSLDGLGPLERVLVDEATQAREAAVVVLVGDHCQSLEGHGVPLFSRMVCLRRLHAAAFHGRNNLHRWLVPEHHRRRTSHPYSDACVSARNPLIPRLNMAELNKSLLSSSKIAIVVTSSTHGTCIVNAK